MATLNEGKIGIEYILNKKGDSLSKKKNIEFKEIVTCETVPDRLSDTMILLTSSTLSLVNKEHLSGMIRPMIWTVTGGDHLYLVCESDTRCSLVKQKDPKGHAARADNSHERLFMQSLKDNIKAEYDRDVPVFDHKGNELVMVGASNEELYLEFADQSNLLLKHPDIPCDRVCSIWHDDTRMAINEHAKKLVRELIERGEHYVPNGIHIDKWNPADTWLLIDHKCKWMMGPYDKVAEARFKKMKLCDLVKLNEFLLEHKIIGVSHKKPSGHPSISAVNSYSRHNPKFIGDNIFHRWIGSKIDPVNKSIYLNFKFGVIDRYGGYEFRGKGNINLRTFKSDMSNLIGMEVKSSVKNAYMSGKAGKFLSWTFEKKKNLLDMIRDTNENKWSLLRNMVTKGEISFMENLTRDTFLNILSKERNHVNASVLQGLIILNEVEYMGHCDQDMFVHQGVKYGKSEILGISGFHYQLR